VHLFGFPTYHHLCQCHTEICFQFRNFLDGRNLKQCPHDGLHFFEHTLGVKLDSHINVNLIPKRAPQWITTVLFKLKYLVLSVIGFVLLYYGTSLIFMIKGRIASIPVLPAYLQFIMIPLAGVLILYDSIMNLLGFEKDDAYLDQKLMRVGEKK
jgi:hypothetical protein